MSAHFLRFGPIVLLALTAIAGCASGNSSPEPDRETPAGRTFVSTQVEGTPIPGGGPLTLSFTDDRVTADAGCNKHSGMVTLDDQKIRVSGLAGTLMACPGDRDGADEWVSGLLNAEPDWKLEDARLTLTADGRTITMLDKKVAQPDKPLRGTAWTVTGLITPDAQIRSRTIDAAAPTLTIGEDGAVTGNAGCNRMSGNADIAGNETTFHIATTKMACSPEVMEVERSVLKALDGTTSTTIDAETLTIRNDNGAGLTLQAS